MTKRKAKHPPKDPEMIGVGYSDVGVDEGKDAQIEKILAEFGGEVIEWGYIFSNSGTRICDAALRPGTAKKAAQAFEEAGFEVIFTNSAVETGP